MAHNSPCVPTGLTATAVSSTEIDLSWTASTGSVAGYKVFRGGSQVGTGTTTTFSDMGLTPSTTYNYNVAAFDASGNTSAQSTGASATTLASSGGGLPSTVGWYQSPNTLLSSVWPNPSTYSDIGGVQGPDSIYSTWGGATADTIRNRLIIWGGGHSAYYGNEVYALNLTANPITLTRLNEPTRFTSHTIGCTDAYWDGNPASRHTYDSLTYSPITDTMTTFSGSLSNCGAFGTGIWSLNLATLTWTEKYSAAPFATMRRDPRLMIQTANWCSSMTDFNFGLTTLLPMLSLMWIQQSKAFAITWLFLAWWLTPFINTCSLWEVVTEAT